MAASDLTLTGLGERTHLMGAGIDLTTHITDVVNMMTWERLSDVVLCGHSYGGFRSDADGTRRAYAPHGRRDRSYDPHHRRGQHDDVGAPERRGAVRSFLWRLPI